MINTDDSIAAKIEAKLASKNKAILEAIGQKATKKIKDSIPTSEGSSSPGSPPHNHSGKLLAGVGYETGTDYVDIWSHYSGEEMLPFWLEYGTKRMAARPYFTPVYYQTGEIVKEAMRDTND